MRPDRECLRRQRRGTRDRFTAAHPAFCPTTCRAPRRRLRQAWRRDAAADTRQRHAALLRQRADAAQQLVLVVLAVGGPLREVEMITAMIDVIDQEPRDRRDVAVPRPSRVVGMAVATRAREDPDTWAGAFGSRLAAGVDGGLVRAGRTACAPRKRARNSAMDQRKARASWLENVSKYDAGGSVSLTDRARDSSIAATMTRCRVPARSTSDRGPACRRRGCDRA